MDVHIPEWVLWMVGVPLSLVAGYIFGLGIMVVKFILTER